MFGTIGGRPQNVDAVAPLSLGIEGYHVMGMALIILGMVIFNRRG
ncbi:conserved hypothetical protein [delta proteobacterium NaphS2]|nr:conserved hypothetical protein [delta proteobacterium NaphS2]